MRACLLACCVVLLGTGGLLAADAKAPPPLIQRACDMIARAGGERLLGIRLDDGRQETARLLARRAWLQAHAPKAYQEILQAENEATRAALAVLIDRLERWRERRQDDKTLAGYLDRKLAAAREDLAALEAPADDDAPAREEAQLVFVEMPLEQVRRKQVQSPRRRALLALAWEHGVDDPEELAAAELVKRLKAKKIDPAEAAPDLSDRVPPRAVDDRQWSAKVAVVEFSLLGKPHYQGTGSQLFDSAEGQRPGIDQLLAGLAGGGGGIDELLKLAGGELPEEPAEAAADDTAAADVLRQAAEAGVAGVRITQLDQDAARGQVTVRERFMARMPDGDWTAVWDVLEQADANQSRPELEKEVAADPQVSQALDALKKLGLGGGQELIDKAIRHGAATLAAQRAADKRFGEFLLRSTRRLDGPTAWSGE